MADIRYHNTEDMPAVILAPDGSVDAYGWIEVTDNRPAAASYDALIKFVREIAGFTLDGEDDGDGGEFIMENDDAWSTLTNVISEARELLKP